MIAVIGVLERFCLTRFFAICFPASNEFYNSPSRYFDFTPIRLCAVSRKSEQSEIEQQPAMKHWPSGKPSSSRNLCADEEIVRRYTEAGWWGTDTLSDIVARHAAYQTDSAASPQHSSHSGSPQHPNNSLRPASQTATSPVSPQGNHLAFIEEDRCWDWRGYHLLSGRLAMFFAKLGFERTERIVVFLPDSGLLHAVYLAAERAGLIVVGIGHRAGRAELSHLVGRCEAVAFVELLEEEADDASENLDASESLFQSLRSEHPQLRHHIRIAEVLDTANQNDFNQDDLPQNNPTPTDLTRNDLVASLLVSVDNKPPEHLQADQRELEAQRRNLPLVDNKPPEHLQADSREDHNPANGMTKTDPQFPTRLGPSELFLLNSTSGTTGLPKCVMQTQNRWFYFHQLAEAYGALTPEDRFCVAVPAPFGFGLWTTHFTPAALGIPTILMRRFSPELMLRLIERERATVLCAVTTQFIMMLNSPDLPRYDLTSLRVLFTGGEAIPPQRAQEFEKQTGAVLLNFYGSNETGVLTGTRIDDSQQVRLNTGGRPVPEMNVRLLHPDTGAVLMRWDEAEYGNDVAEEQDGQIAQKDQTTQKPDKSNIAENLDTEAILQGVPACRGPATTLGYYDDDAANGELFTEDGWMLMGDIVRFTDDCLQVVGRTSDFIIRGGKNISAPAVEAEVMTHPAVRLAAAVAAPDEVFGERVAVYVELREGTTLDLESLTAHLTSRGISKEWFPEHLVIVDTIPRSSGAKMAKGDLRKDIARRLES